MNILLSTLNAKYIHSSLALRSIAAYSKEQGQRTTTREYTINNGLLEILSDIYACKPDVVGLACYIWNIETTLELVKLLKKVKPEIVIILGGPEVSYQAGELLKETPEIDYIVLGEGELTMKSLLEALANGQTMANIPGLAYRKQGGIIAEEPQVVPDLGVLPFPYSNDEMSLLRDKIIYYESSRGCPFSCQYCLSSATAGVRFLNLERVMTDLKFFIEHDVRQVKFVDRTFNARKEHYFPILKFLAGQECRTNFHFEIAADIWDEEVLEFLHLVPPGRFQFEIGIQSTHVETLKAIKRHNNWPKIVESVSRVRDYGNIHLHLDLIVGLPFETLDILAKSFNDVYALQPEMLQIGFLKMLRGSGVREEASRHNYIYMDKAPYEVLGNKYLSYSEVRHLKIFEDVFEQLHNSGRFRHSLTWIISTSGSDPFNFYYKLALYWEQKGYHLSAHSSKTLYRYMAEFCRDFYPDDFMDYLEFLKFDALTSERGGVRPEFLPWNQADQAASDPWAECKTNFWRNNDKVSKYITDYSFTTWRDIKKRYHIEVFAADIPAYIKKSGNLVRRQAVVLFTYCKEKTEYQVINDDDFWA